MDLPLDDHLSSACRPCIGVPSPPRGRGCPPSTNCGPGRPGRPLRLRFDVGRRSRRLHDRDLRPAAAARAGRRAEPAPGVRHGRLPVAVAPSDPRRQAGLHARPFDGRALHLRRRRGWRVSQGVRGLRRAAQRTRRAAERKPHDHAQAVERRAGLPCRQVLQFRGREDAAAATASRRAADLVRRPR